MDIDPSPIAEKADGKDSSRKRSFVWKYFVQSHSGKQVTCRLCGKTLSYSIASGSNMRRHISRSHPDQFKEHQLSATSVTKPQSQLKIETVEGAETSKGTSYEISLKGFEDMETVNNPDEVQTEVSDGNMQFTTTVDWEELNTTITTAPEATDENKDKKVSKKVRSAVWSHFDRSECKTKGTCHYCGTIIKTAAISNLARHLRKKHPTVPVVMQKPFRKNVIMVDTYDDDMDQAENFKNGNHRVNICTEVIEVNIDDLQNPSNIVETRAEDSGNLFEFTLEDLEEAVNTTQASQTEFMEEDEFDINDYIRPKKTAVVSEQLDRLLVKMLVKGCYPLEMIEGSGFKEFTNALNPKYVIPSVQKVVKELIPEMYMECEKKACKSLQQAEGVCLFIDQWKAKNSIYMCITAHIVNMECKFEPIFLSCHILYESEDLNDIKGRLQQTINDWEISEKTVAIVTDGTVDVARAVVANNWPHIPHFIRTLCEVLHEGIQTVDTYVHKVNIVIAHIKKFPEVLGEIYSTQRKLKHPPVKLITKVQTNSSSSFTIIEMLSRFFKLKDAICAVHKSKPQLSDSDWKVLGNIVDVLSVFKEVKKGLLSEDRVCVSKVVFYIRVLRKEMRKFLNASNNCAMAQDATYMTSLLELNLNERFKSLNEMELTHKVLLLDPRLKKHAFDDESEFAVACSLVKKEVCEVVMAEPVYPEPDPKSIWYHFDSEVKKINSVKDPIGKGILELENYLQEEILGRNEDPFLWWFQRKAIYPRLYRLAKKYLCITARCAQRESISFKSAQMLARLKYGDSPTTESQVMFLHHNL